LISNFRRDLNILYVLLGISPASNCSWPTFRNPVSVPPSKAGCRQGECALLCQGMSKFEHCLVGEKLMQNLWVVRKFIMVYSISQYTYFIKVFFSFRISEFQATRLLFMPVRILQPSLRRFSRSWHKA